jgi:hypothetical protein
MINTYFKKYRARSFFSGLSAGAAMGEGSDQQHDIDANNVSSIKNDYVETNA